MVAVAGHVNQDLEARYGDFGDMTKGLLALEEEEVSAA